MFSKKRPSNYSLHSQIFKNISNHPKLFHSDETDAQMYMFNYKNTCTFGFRGTDSLKDILIDLAMWREVFSEVSDEILVHSGIYSQFKSFVLKELPSFLL